MIDRSTPEGGRFRTIPTPFLQDALDERPVLVVVSKAQALGPTELVVPGLFLETPEEADLSDRCTPED